MPSWIGSTHHEIKPNWVREKRYKKGFEELNAPFLCLMTTYFNMHFPSEMSQHLIRQLKHIKNSEMKCFKYTLYQKGKK